MDFDPESSTERSEEKPPAPRKGEPAMEFGTYIRVWIAIIALTAISFTFSQLKIGGWEVLLALLIAGAQSALILYYFMHLRQEKARIFKIIIPLVLSILVIFMALTFSDVAFRG